MSKLKFFKAFVNLLGRKTENRHGNIPATEWTPVHVSHR